MIKGNWAGGPNARLGQTADCVIEKIMAESIKWARKIGEGILVDQNEKEKKEIKIGKIWTIENRKFDSNGF
jgi:hypothetical protein